MSTYSHSTIGRSAVAGTIGHKYIFHTTGKSAVSGSTTQSSQHHHTVGRSSIKGSITQSSLHHHTVGRSSVIGTINKGLRHSTLGRSAIVGLARTATMRHSTLGKSSILGIAFISKLPSPDSTVGYSTITGVVRQNRIPRVGTSQGVASSTAVGVLPQTGSGIYTSWTHRRSKEITVNRLWDLRESGKANYDDTRNAWALEMNVNAEKRDEIFQFILDHKGSGIPFKFYDLENNNFQFDPLGTLNDGRYTVRYVDDSFNVTQEVGSRSFARFTLSFSVVEVE